MLIVDDNEDMRVFLSQMFMDEYDIVWAENGQAALDLALIKKKLNC